MSFDMPRDEPIDREEYDKWEAEQSICEPVGGFWICCGPCGQWRKGPPTAHNGSGYVCHECETKTQDERVKRKLIGLVGHAGAGKDAAAEGLTALGWERVSFADPLRQMALAIDPYIPAHASASSRLSGYVEAVGWTKAKQHPEVRRLLQAIGTEAVRDIIGSETWVDLAAKKICSSTKSVVVTDVRFANEAMMIRNLGGVLVRITRPGCGPVNDHVSDALVHSITVDTVIMNDGTLEELQGRLVRLSKWVAGVDGRTWAVAGASE